MLYLQYTVDFHTGPGSKQRQCFILDNNDMFTSKVVKIEFHSMKSIIAQFYKLLAASHHIGRTCFMIRDASTIRFMPHCTAHAVTLALTDIALFCPLSTNRLCGKELYE